MIGDEDPNSAFGKLFHDALYLVNGDRVYSAKGSSSNRNLGSMARALAISVRRRSPPEREKALAYGSGLCRIRREGIPAFSVFPSGKAPSWSRGWPICFARPSFSGKCSLLEGDMLSEAGLLNIGFLVIS